MKIAIFGGGVMGKTYATAFLQNKLVKPENLYLIETATEKAVELKKANLGVILESLTPEIFDQLTMAFLCIKPQDFNSLGVELMNRFQPETIVFSIMAGKKIAEIQAITHHNAVVRAMPNAPVLIGEGITAYITSEQITDTQKELINVILSTTGEAVSIEQEELMDTVTALSGSGPAYFYLFVKHLIKAGMELGLTNETATLLVKQTLKGSHALMKDVHFDFDAAIKNVASPGGTTQAALDCFAKNDLENVVVQAVTLAQQRGKALAENK
jgi:pyrroline-5-carboxylate reductase